MFFRLLIRSSTSNRTIFFSQLGVPCAFFAPIEALLHFAWKLTFDLHLICFDYYNNIKFLFLLHSMQNSAHALILIIVIQSPFFVCVCNVLSFFYFHAVFFSFRISI